MPITGVFEDLQLPDGTQVPWYVLRFDKRGQLESTETREHLLGKVAEGDFTDIYLFSHGWNNDWDDALKRYRGFISELGKLRQEHQLTLTRRYQPLLVGVFWPSVILVLPWEKGPEIAAPGADSLQPDLAVLQEDLSEAEMAEVSALARKDRLSSAEAQRLAEFLAPLYRPESEDEALGDVAPPEPAELISTWREIERLRPDGPSTGSGQGGLITGGGGPTGGPQAAGSLSFLDPRGPFRAATVWKMKDRAGKVGTHGVGPLLRALKERAGAARFHLIGHSYGARVMLAALSSAPLPGDGKVWSLLLLQPAVNGWCFAADVDEEHFAGGFRPTLRRVQRPILSTFSKHDGPLSKLFHLAVRRRQDLGEVEFAAKAPNRFAALGGYGAKGLSDVEYREIPMPTPTQAYSLDEVEVLGLRGDAVIGGHGDVVNPATAWALWSLVSS